MLPLSVVESKEFRELLSFLEPEYKAFDKKGLKARIAALYDEQIANINKSLQDFESISADVDGWTSIANQGYVTINAHGINKNWELVNFNLETKEIEGKHTAKNIVKEVNETFEKYNIKE